jgi:hypothetical protein
MINGAHALIYSKAPDELRAFFRDVLGLASMDAGRGWLIFALPPAELAVHPAEQSGRCELYLMCDDVRETVDTLKKQGVQFGGPVQDEPWGLVTSIRLPGGSELGLYQPKHPTAAGMSK